MTGTRKIRAAAAVLPVALVMAASLGVSAASAATDRPDTAKAARAAGALAQNTWTKESLTTKDVDWFRYDVTGSGRVMATLGGLPGDYSLALYDGHGTKLATSTRSGKKFERVTAKVTEGSYYVKVWSSGAYSAKAYQLKFRTLPAGVIVLDNHIEYATSKGKPVNAWAAEVYNNTSSWQSVTGWQVTYFGQDGEELPGGTGAAWKYPRPLGPGATLSVHSGSTGSPVETSPAGTVKLKIAIDSTAISKPKLSYGFKVRSTKKVAKGLRYTVRITNKGAARPLLLVASGYSSYGNLAGIIETGGKVKAATVEDWTFTLPGSQPNYTRFALVPGT